MCCVHLYGKICCKHAYTFYRYMISLLLLVRCVVVAVSFLLASNKVDEEPVVVIYTFLYSLTFILDEAGFSHFV